jgi:hypothetical protein
MLDSSHRSVIDLAGGFVLPVSQAFASGATAWLAFAFGTDLLLAAIPILFGGRGTAGFRFPTPCAGRPWLPDQPFRCQSSPATGPGRALGLGVGSGPLSQGLCPQRSM